MPRKPVVSRTLKYTRCRCLLIDLKTKTQLTQNIDVLGCYTKQEINKKGDKLFSTPKIKFITCLRVTQITKQYSMDLNEFIRAANLIQ